MRLLLVEDDVAFGSALRDGLRLEGHDVQWQRDGADLAAVLAARPCDAVVLDLGLPDVDGRVLLRQMRARGDATPVVVLTGRGQIADRIGLLDEGADDYLVKPVDLAELTARLRAVQRRGAPGEAPRRHGALLFDRARRRVMLGRRQIELREREFALLEIFLREPGRVFSRARLEALVYGPGHDAASNAIEVHVHFLRRKIGRDIVVTLRGEGYRLGPAPEGG